MYDSLSDALIKSIPCRESQIRQLVSLLDPRFPSPSTIVVHGHEATGKSLTLGAILDGIGVPSAVVRSRECITSRHLLEQTVSASKEALEAGIPDDLIESVDERCENISAFAVQLQRLLEGRGKFILVFDGIDQQREALPTLISAIARLGETILNLTIIVMVRNPCGRTLNLTGVPHVQFVPYSRAESLHIISSSPLSSHETPNDSISSFISDDDRAWLWSRFVTAVWDSIGQAAARDVVSFRAVCTKLWHPFIEPVIKGHYTPREFSKLMVKNRALFQSEVPLQDSVISTDLSAPSTHPAASPSPFPHFTAHLLCAAYLASYTPPRNDTLLFSKSSHLTSRRRKKNRSGISKQPRKPSRHLLGPRAFPLERLFAIFHAILPSPTVGGRADLLEQLATLRRLRLIVRGGAGDEAVGIGIGRGKWRVGCGVEFARTVARGVGLDLEEFFIE